MVVGSLQESDTSAVTGGGEYLTVVACEGSASFPAKSLFQLSY